MSAVRSVDAKRTTKTSAKVAKKAAAKRVAAKATKPRKAVATSSDHMSASKRIDKKIADLSDWRGERLAQVRAFIHEDDQLDEAQLAAWVKQASQLPGVRM